MVRNNLLALYVGNENCARVAKDPSVKASSLTLSPSPQEGSQDKRRRRRNILRGHSCSEGTNILLFSSNASMKRNYLQQDQIIPQNQEH